MINQLKNCLNSEPENTIILCGAGISRDKPSEIPTAIETIKAYLDVSLNLSENILFQNLYKQYIEQILNKVRFEVFFSLVKRYFDKKLESLITILNKQHSNTIHYLLADFIFKGGIVWTTNFDLLIEKAYHELFSEILEPVIDYQNTFFEVNSKYHKMHGSLDLKNQQKNMNIAVTIETIAYETYFFNKNKDRYFQRKKMMHNRNLIVLGYSGSDDFDIVPFLNDCIPKQVFWINHKPNKIEEENVIEQKISKKFSFKINF